MRIAAICIFALAAVTVPATAEVVTNDKTDLLLSVFVPCAAGGAGEIVDLSGSLHTMLSFTMNGNNVSGYYHFQPQGISGVGESSGVTFRATGVTAQSFKSSFHSGEANLTYVNNFRIVGQGSGNNFLVHDTIHITVNTDGTTSVIHDNFFADCH